MNDARNDARREWYEARKRQILTAVSAYDILRHNGIDIPGTDDREAQFPCPFHGADNKPSARIFPEDGDKPSHVWCFVCQVPHWDAIGLWRMFNGGYENCKYSEALFGIEKRFSLERIDPGFHIEKPKPPEDPLLQEFKSLYVSCDNLLLASKDSFKYFNDMKTYLSIGSALDQIRWAVDNKKMPLAKAVDLVKKLLEKVQKIRRSCPVG